MMDAFIKANRQRRVEDLALELSRRSDLDAAFVLRQVEGWQKMRTKVPRWTEVEGIHYPPRLALEQCSGQRAAEYKAQVIARLIGKGAQAAGNEAQAAGNGPQAAGKGAQAAAPHASAAAGSSETSLCDLTGGMGVDFSFLAPLFDERTYVEQRAELVKAARHNLPLLGLGNTTIVHGDGVAHLRDMKPVTVLFLDPARRDSHGGKTVLIEDCEPNVAELLPLLRRKAAWVMVKLSPMLDVHRAIATLEDIHPGCVHEVHVFATGGECKDLLLVIHGAASAGFSPRIVCCEDGRTLAYTIEEENDTNCSFVTAESLTAALSSGDAKATCNTQAAGDAEAKSGTPQWLYEPGPAVMKAGAFRTVAARYGLRKLHANSHLYVGERLIADFPGRAFAIKRIYGFGKADLKALAADLKPEGGKANLTVRNFPATVADLRKKLKLRDGGTAYLFATTDADNARIIIRGEKV